MTLLRDLILVIGGRLLTALVSLVALRYSTALLSPAQYGLLALLIAVQSFCGLMLINPVAQHLTRNIFPWIGDGTLLSRLPAFSAYVAAASAVGAGVSTTLGVQTSADLAVVFANIAFINCHTMLSATLNMMHLRAASVGWSIGAATVGLGAALIMASAWPTAIAWFAGQAVGWAVGAIGCYLILQRSVARAAGVPRYMALIDGRTLLRFCLPLAIATGCMWLLTNGYRFVVSDHWGLAALGLVATGFILAGQLWSLVETLVMQMFMPSFYKRISDDSSEEARAALSDMINAIGPIYLVLLAASLLGANALLWLFVDDKYLAAGQYLMVGALLEAARALCNLFGLAVQITRRTYVFALPFALGASTVIALLELAGRHHLDLEAAVWAVAVGAAITLVSMKVWMHREVSFELDASRWIGAICVAGAAGWIAIGRPLEPGSLADAALFTGGIGLVGLVLVAALLWKNQPARRLLSAASTRSTL